MNNTIERTWRRYGLTFVEDLRGTGFTAENGAHTFIISGVDTDNNSITLSGTVAASFIRPDGTTTAMTGSIAAGKAQVTLSAECYGVAGRGTLTIFLTSGGQKVAIYSAVLNIVRSNTNQVSPGVTSDVVDLVNRIDTATASIPSTYTNLLASLAPDYSSSATYKTGDYVWYNGYLYKAKQDISTAESWTAAHWTRVVMSADLTSQITSLKTDLTSQVTDLKSALDDLNDFCRASTPYDVTQNTEVSSGTLNKIIANVHIPSGISYTIIVNDPDSLIPNGVLTLYYKDINGSNHSIRVISTNTEYNITAVEDIYAIVGYKSGVVTAGTLSTEVAWRVPGDPDNLEKRISDLDNEVEDLDRRSIDTFSTITTLTEADLEVGNIQDGTGKLVNVNSRYRTIEYIPAYKGLVLHSIKSFNVFEYDLLTGQYIYSTSGWKNSYTVTQNCKIKILFNSTSTSDIISGFSTETPFLTISKSITPVDFVRQIIGDMQYMPSKTVRTIAHRGRYGFNIGMECGLSGVIAAKRYGITTVENDVALTSDGKMVMWHDSTLSKIGDSSHSVSDYTLAELKAMNFGIHFGEAFDGETILTFEEWIVACKKIGVECYIDFKVTAENFTTSMAEDLVEIVKKYGMLGHVSYLNNQAKIRRYHSNARLVMLVPPTAERIESFQQYLANGPVAFDPNGTNVTQEMAELALLNGYEMECYYVEYDVTDKSTIFNEVDRLVGCGVQGITMDYYKIEDVFNQKYGLLN